MVKVLACVALKAKVKLVYTLIFGLYPAADLLRLDYKQDRQCTCKHDIEARPRKHYCRGKAVNITYSECIFVALGIQHEKRMRRIILSSLALPHFTTLSHKSHDSRG